MAELGDEAEPQKPPVGWAQTSRYPPGFAPPRAEQRRVIWGSIFLVAVLTAAAINVFLALAPRSPSSSSSSVPQGPFIPVALGDSQMIVAPNAGSVGTSVFIEGRRCDGSGHVEVSFNGTAVHLTLPELSENAKGYFSYFWTIPAEAPALTGAGNTAVTPGSYIFGTRGCRASFAVTS